MSLPRQSLHIFQFLLLSIFIVSDHLLKSIGVLRRENLVVSLALGAILRLTADRSVLYWEPGKPRPLLPMCADTVPR